MAGSFADKEDVPVTLSFAAGPPNDEFANRTLLSGENISSGGTTVNATRQTDEPNHAGRTGGRSLWWSWTAPESNMATLLVSANNFAPILSVYTGTDLPTLIPVASAASSTLTFRAEAGSVYQIALDGNNGGSGSYSMKLLTAPHNDHFSNRFVLGGLSEAIAANNEMATSEVGEPIAARASSKTLWWSWTAPTNLVVTIGIDDSTLGAPFDASTLQGRRYVQGPLLNVFTGENVADLALVASNNVLYFYGTIPGPWLIRTNCTFDAIPGTTYNIALDGCNGYAGNVAMSFTASPPAPPGNDDFASRTVLAGEDIRFVGGNRFATREPDEPVHPGASGGASIWWTWTAPASGFVELSVAETNILPVLAVYIGNTLQTLSLVANGTTTAKFSAVAGVPYQIVMDGAQTNQGSAVFHLQLRRHPLNDDFANRLVITGGQFSGWSSNVNATAEPGEPAHPGSIGSNSVWFSWTSPVHGDVAVTLYRGRGLPFAVYTGSTLSNLQLVALAPDANKYLSARFYAAAGTTYQIAVYDDAGAEGEFELQILTPPPDPALDRASTVMSSNGILRLGIQGATGQSFVLQASTNLVDWTTLATDTFLDNALQYVDWEAGSFDRRFYRVLTLDALFRPGRLNVATQAFHDLGGFRIPISGPPGQPYSLQATTNLVDWVELSRGFMTDQNILLLDENANLFPVRFYKVVPTP